MYRIIIVFSYILFHWNLLMAVDKTVTIDVNVEYQTIDNFGASDCWSFQKIGTWVEPQKEKVADLLFSTDKGIGLLAWRFNIGAGINRATIYHPWRTVETFEISEGNYDWSRQQEERWFLEAAKERGVNQFIAFVNSPPARMTCNGYTNCTDGLCTTNLKNGYEGQFATYLTDILKHFRDEWGIEFDYISPVNEPQWEWNIGSNQEGNRASNDDIKLIVDALYAELQKQGLDTKISLVESGDLRSWYQERSSMAGEYGETYGNYLNMIFASGGVKDKIAHHLGGHSYWSDRISTQLTQDREALYLKFFPYLFSGWKYWMTEYTILDGPEGRGGHGRDLTMKTALDVARVIHYDLTILKASAWQWWTAVSPEDYKDGLIYTNYMDNPNSQSIIESKLLWALGNYSRFIRPGSVRVKLTGADDKYLFLGSAYTSPNRDKLIIVLQNLSDNETSIKLNITGFKSGNSVYLTPYVTSDVVGDDLKQYPAFLSANAYQMPPRSIVTLVSELDTSVSTDGKSPSEYTLLYNSPNPFNDSTNLYYYMPAAGTVNISIYNIAGQLIKTLTAHNDSAGIKHISWNGSDNSNKRVGSGVYIYSLKVNDFFDTKKMLFLQ